MADVNVFNLLAIYSEQLWEFDFEKNEETTRETILKLEYEERKGTNEERNMAEMSP